MQRLFQDRFQLYPGLLVTFAALGMDHAFAELPAIPEPGPLVCWVNPFVGTGVNSWSLHHLLVPNPKEIKPENLDQKIDRKPPPPKWQKLFNNKDFTGWKTSLFGADGEIRVAQKQMVIGYGLPMSGLRYLGKVPTRDYEIRLEAKRVSGSDFFCGLTFPVHKSHCSLIVGGWGGGVVGLSNIDGLDASQNETTQYRSFENDRWYKIRIRITAQRIECWLDDKQIINQDIRHREISLRNEMRPTRPLGLATWQTAAAVKNIEMRSVKIKNDTSD